MLLAMTKQSQAKVPPVVYKYLTKEGGVASLRSISVKYSPPDEFNDPFEGMLRNFNQSELEELFFLAREAIHTEQAWRKFCHSSPFADNEQLFSLRHDILIGRVDLERVLRLGLNETAEGMTNGFIHDISKRMGIACFSARKDSILMWSHYAQNHTGIVVGYRSRSLGTLLPIHYRTDRMPLPFGQFKKTPNRLAAKKWPIELWTSKFSDWQYEQEWRSLSPIEKLQTKKVKGSVMFLKKLRPQSISEIIMGTRIDDGLKMECFSFVRSHHQCSLFQARYHKRDYALEFIPVNDAKESSNGI